MHFGLALSSRVRGEGAFPTLGLTGCGQLQFRVVTGGVVPATRHDCSSANLPRAQGIRAGFRVWRQLVRADNSCTCVHKRNPLFWKWRCFCDEFRSQKTASS